MNPQPSSLQPFSGSGDLSGSSDPPELKISGTLSRHSNTLAINYELSGSLDRIKIPLPESKPVRKNRLWEETCFELFIGIKGTDPYWEFNLSPSGNWNVYRFNDYRKGMAEETAFSTLPFCVTHTPDSLKMILEISLNKILPPAQALQAGISAVIKNNHGNITYWALTHPGPKPDFHQPDSFILEL
jgi:hypothetical protein